ncbi:membrane protein [Roseobacter cerasinus]|uniref:Membrane protein n=1 Tax=Roseobacter cerasinus TaxID=2602289 RepID=A0A640VVI5_9RHOB|nr:YjgN family protein [Roseobacter cerasinus]GFE51101.1 membrane protein [Roseobacter cerasinus]
MSIGLPSDAKPFKFKGNAREWFGIWIVNLLLSILTIGIYSAWAKVRAKKYFCNNTYVEGRNFDYHATGKQILIGRLIIIAFFVVFQVILTTAPVLGLILAVGLIFAYPWLIVRSMQFNARMTSFSNVRFGFVGTTGQAVLVFLIYPILMALTLYTTFPIWDRAVKRFSIDNHKLGQARFKFDAGLGAFYKALLAALTWILAVGVIGVLVTGFSFSAFYIALDNAESDPGVAIAAVGLIYLMFFAAILPAAFIYQALVRNEVYNTTTLEGGHRFASCVSAPRLLWLAISNMVVVVFTLFLMLPWAQVRMARYLTSHTGLIPGDTLDEFVNQQQAEGSAAGDAYTDLEGIDVGLPV